MQNQFLALCADVHQVSIDVAREMIKREIVIAHWQRMKQNGATWRELFDAKGDYVYPYLQNVYDCGCYFEGMNRIDFFYLLEK